MRVFLVAMMGWMLMAPASAAEPVADVSYLRAFWQGTKAYVQGDFAGAERAFHAALAVRPDSAAAHDNAGEALFRAGKLPEAAAEFQKAMETSDRLAKSRAAYNLGNVMVKQDKLEDAVAAYKKALRWNERDEDARWNLNVVMRKLKEQKQKQDQKDKKDQRQPKSDKDQQQKQQSKSDKDKKQSKSDKDKKQDKGSPKDPQQGKGTPKDPQQDKPQAQKPSPSPSAQPQAQAKPSPSPSSAVAGAAERGDPGMSKQDAERLLRYFQEKERSQVPKHAPNGRTWTAAPGEQTW